MPLYIYRTLSFQAWSRVVIALVFLGLGGCGGGVQLVKEGKRHGVVQYFYKRNKGYMLAEKRAEAFQAIQEFCNGPFDVVREGQTKDRQWIIEGVFGSDVLVETWWGIRFRCSK